MWTMIGGGQGGNFMYPSQEDLCPATVGGSTNSAECSADWNTYGDQFIGATFTSGSINVSQELETEVVAPVDLAQGLTFSNYQNAGPEAIGDCSMAAAADWIEATYNVSPDEASVVDAYWSAEDEYNGGTDVGLNQTQLFDYWRAYGISGSYLTGTLSVSIDETDVEDALSSGYVLLKHRADDRVLGAGGSDHLVGVQHLDARRMGDPRVFIAIPASQSQAGVRPSRRDAIE
ncbi:MAG: hypothetical protein ABSC73_07585 [Acidimicrobiales bacterium]